MKTQKLIPGLLIAAGFLAYCNIYQAPFIFDDAFNIVNNPSIRQLGAAWRILTHSSRPLVQLSLMLNYALGGLNPWGYHLFNVCIHILAALTLYGVVRRTLLSGTLRSRWGGPAPWLAGLVAAIWLVHPLQTESVTYTIQRAQSMMGLFYLLTLYCVIRSSGSPRNVWWQIGAVASGVLGMASKLDMVTIPVTVLLYDRAFLAGFWGEAIIRRWKVYTGLAATWVLAAILMERGKWEVAGWQPTAGFGYKAITPLQYALTQPGVVLHYLWLAVWPEHLCFDYGYHFGFPVAHTVAEAAPALLVMGGLLAVTIWAWRRSPALGFLGAACFIPLAPTSSFVPIADLVVEHRMYLSLAPVATAVVLGTFWLGKRLLGKRQGPGRGLAIALGGSTVLLLIGLTIRRNLDYASEHSIWQDTVSKCPNNPRAHYNLGVVLGQTGDLPAAKQQYEQAVRLWPDYVEAHDNLGSVLYRLGDLQDAISHYQQALRINPHWGPTLRELGGLLVIAGNAPEAIRDCQEALRVDPDDAVARSNLDRALQLAGRDRQSIESLEQAVRDKPEDATLRYNLGLALDKADRPQEAIERYQQALQIRTDYPEAHYNLGVDLFQAGKVNEALSHLEQAVQLKPDYAEARNDWAIMLAQTGRPEEAIQQFEEALRTNPAQPETQFNLGVVLLQAKRYQEAIPHFEEALRMRPDYPEARSALRQARMRIGDPGNQDRP